MSLQCIGFLGINGDIIGSGNIVCSPQLNSNIVFVFHTGKGSSDIYRRNTHIKNLGFVFTLVQGGHSYIFCALDGAVRDANIRGSLVDDTSIAYAYPNTDGTGTGLDFNLRAFVLLGLLGLDGDVLASDGGPVHGHIGVVVGMNNIVSHSGRYTATNCYIQIFLENITGVLSRYIDIARSRQRFPANLGMRALLSGIRRSITIGRGGKAYTHISCRI